MRSFFTATPTIAPNLSERIVSAKELKLAVAYWGEQACDRLGLSKLQHLDHVTVLCDAMSGGCNPKTLHVLLKRDAKLYACGGLHAKVYIAPDWIWCGSANASANGLAYEDEEIERSIEAGVLSSEESLIKTANAWFKGLQCPTMSCVEISKEMIDGPIADAWRHKRATRYTGEISRGLIEAWNTPSRRATFKDHDIYVFVYRYENLTKKAEKKRRDWEKLYPKSHEIGGYQIAAPGGGPPKIGSVVVDINLKDSKVEFDGICKFISPPLRSENQKYPVVICKKLPDLFRTVITHQDKIALVRAAKAELGKIDTNGLSSRTFFDFMTEYFGI